MPAHEFGVFVNELKLTDRTLDDFGVELPPTEHESRKEGPVTHEIDDTRDAFRESMNGVKRGRSKRHFASPTGNS